MNIELILPLAGVLALLFVVYKNHSQHKKLPNLSELRWWINKQKLNLKELNQLIPVEV